MPRPELDWETMRYEPFKPKGWTMKASELVSKLNALIAADGDRDVAIHLGQAWVEAVDVRSSGAIDECRFTMPNEGIVVDAGGRWSR